MATWHPPIPANKLYSEPALKLGPALAMLVWCYDGIQQDSTIEIRLESIQQELNVSYRTIKDWWKLLKEGPFFCEQIDRGKRGWVVRMADDWIDWHVMGNNYPNSRPRQGQNSAPNDQKVPSSRPTEGQESDLEGRQGPVKAPSRTGEGQSSALEKPAYKEDQQDQESKSHGGSEDRDGTARTHPPQVATLLEIFPEATISVEQTDDLCSISNLALWREVLMTWRANGYKPRIGNLLDRYHKEQANGTHQSQRSTDKNGRLPDIAVRRTRQRYDLDG